MPIGTSVLKFYSSSASVPWLAAASFDASENSGLERNPVMSKRASRPFSILVGPPHPISNLRPVLYNGIPDQTKTNAYSPNELRPNLSLDPTKFQLDLTLQRLDKFNHDFWLNVSILFNGGQPPALALAPFFNLLTLFLFSSFFFLLRAMSVFIL